MSVIELQVEMCESADEMGFGIFHDGVYIGRVSHGHVREILTAFDLIKERKVNGQGKGRRLAHKT
jgi:hypothetical protein